MTTPPTPQSELPWGKRPVTARDMAIVTGIFVVTCIAGAVMVLFALSGQPERVAVEPEPVDVALSEPTDAGATGEVQTGAPASGSESAGQAIFDAQCAACHTIGGGDLVGPDLEGVVERRDYDWLARWIREPDAVLAEGDPLATSLLEEYNNVPMPNLGLSQAQVDDVITYLQNPGGGDAGPAAGAALPEGDAERGKELFVGAAPLQNGGPACMSCHSTTDAGALGGGTLGPDLTHVYQRYGEAGLPPTLLNLPFPTMQGVFGERPLREQEAADLYAYFVQVDQGTAEGIDYTFVATGLVVFTLLLLSAHVIWRRRLNAVRKPLLGGAQ